MFSYLVFHNLGKDMAIEDDFDLSALQSQLSESHETWKQEMEKRQSQVDVLQAKIIEVM